MRIVGIYAAVFAAAWSAAFPAQADPRDDALSAMLRCSALQDRGARLGCYDATVSRAPGAMNSVLVAPPRPVASAVPPPAAPAPARRERSSGFISGIFGSGPSRAVQTSPAQFGSESIAMAGHAPIPSPWTATPSTRSAADRLCF